LTSGETSVNSVAGKRGETDRRHFRWFRILGKIVDSTELAEIALDVSKFLKAIANPDRLQILCLLVQEEMNVTALEHATGIAQPRLSQHLARLRKEGLVHDRRLAKEKLYSLSSDETQEVITLLHRLFCAPKPS
jgi:DNA-binding transcriptional ArsR family regulator